MKKLLISILMLTIALAACSAGEGTTTEETAELPTEAALATVPPATEEPTAEPTTEPTAEPTLEPTATDIPTTTPSPEPTETAASTATTDPQSAPPQEEAPADNSGTIPETVDFPEGAVIIFTQSGGFAGFDNTWVFYADGRVTYNGEEGSQQTPERINAIINELDDLGFFQLEYITGPNDFCCDFFYYTLAVQTQNRQNYVSFSEGDPNLPQALWDILFLMQEIAQEAQAR